MTEKRKMPKPLKIAIISVCSLVGVVLLAAVAYVGYVLIDYSRIEDNTVLQADNRGSDSGVKVGETYTVFSQNIGFGAYTSDYSFFMDGGEKSWAESEESVIDCVNMAADTANSFSPDFALFQEVDTDSTRSYHVDQQKIITDRFSKHSNVFAVNYHSAFLFYPFDEPHGASNSGLLTLSRFNISSSVRRSLPISTGFSKFLDLDRCYSVSKIPTENGKELVIYNVHLSAYGGSPEIREAQMTMLFTDIKSEYDEGNYIICGGDFNHDFTTDSRQKLNGENALDFDWAQPFPTEMLPQGFSTCTDYDGEYVPTCRNTDAPYYDGCFTVILDGFIISENVECVSVKNIDTGFEYSDHNPVVLMFSLTD